MQIITPSHNRWRKSLTSDSTEQFGKNSAARIRSTLKKIASQDVSWSFTTLQQNDFDWFLPLYEDQISQKANPNVFNVQNRTLNTGKNYSLLTLFEDGKPIGGTIFRINADNVCMIAFRIYQNKWQSANLQAKPSLLTEYLLCEYVKEHGATTLSHGKDRSPYGQYASIGLAVFKLSVGCNLYLPDNYEYKTVDLQTFSADSLVLEHPTDDSIELKKGFLVTTPETESKWLQVTKYPHLLEVEIIYRES